jgi:RNA polymerase sigma-70 factor (ECF subfamily)
MRPVVGVSPGQNETEFSDATLTSRIREGDVTAIEHVFAKYASSMLALATQLIGSQSDAEDVVQDLFVGLPTAARSYIEQGQLEAWLRRITVRLCLMSMRRDRNRRQVSLEEMEPADPSSRMITQIALSDAIMKLPVGLRLVFVLKEIAHYTHAEIGSIIGIRPGTSEVRLFRAIRLLRKTLGQQHD